MGNAARVPLSIVIFKRFPFKKSDYWQSDLRKNLLQEVQITADDDGKQQFLQQHETLDWNVETFLLITRFQNCKGKTKVIAKKHYY